MREYENNSPHAYLTTLSLKQAIMDIIFEFQKEYPFLINFRVLFVIIPNSIGTERPIKMLLARMASTYKKKSYQRTGKHPSRICLDMIVGP